MMLERTVKKNISINWGRDIIVDWCVRHAGGHSIRVLDVGCGLGYDLMNVGAALKGAKLYGIECDPAKISRVRKMGVAVYPLDIEKQPIPAKDGFFDVVIANQVIEHAKEIFWVFSEISRALAPGGMLVIGVPNMASFHNRLLLLLGEQPTCVETLGPHVRGYTAPSLRRFIEEGGYFKVEMVRGANFYPFPPPVSRPLSRLFPGLSASIFIRARRTEKPGVFARVLDGRQFETPFFTG